MYTYICTYACVYIYIYTCVVIDCVYGVYCDDKDSLASRRGRDERFVRYRGVANTIRVAIVCLDTHMLPQIPCVLPQLPYILPQLP